MSRKSHKLSTIKKDEVKQNEKAALVISTVYINDTNDNDEANDENEEDDDEYVKTDLK